jgi:hypothetical protein
MDLRHWVRSGKRLLAASISGFDPERTSCCFGFGAKIKLCPVQVHPAAEKETFLAIRRIACELLTVYRFR